MSTAKPDSAALLHTDAILFDGLIVSKWSPRIFDEMGLGGLTAANCTCSVLENFQRTMDNIAQWKRWFRQYDQRIL
jgi:membrane dipeptidase